MSITGINCLTLQREFLGKKVKWVILDDLCTVVRGEVISRQYLNEHTGIYPVYSSQTQDNGILGYIDSYRYVGSYLTWTTDGANAGTVFRRSGKFNITNVCGLIEVVSVDCMIDFLYYWLQKTMQKYVTSGMGNPKLMSNVVKKIPVPLPSLDGQQYIVDVLDRFEALCSDLSIGLPAEIKARQKQYEHYRDKLLTFEPNCKIE